MLLKIVEKGFHTLECRCVYEINFTFTTNNEEFFVTISHEYMTFKCEHYGCKKSKKQETLVLYLMN